MNVFKYTIRVVVLFFAFILTILMKLILSIGFLRLQFSMSEALDIDMGHIVTYSFRWLNQFWDVILNRNIKQPHHHPKDLFWSVFIGSLKTIKLLFLSLFSWRR